MKTYTTHPALKNYLLAFVIMLVTASAQSQSSQYIVSNVATVSQTAVAQSQGLTVSHLASFNGLKADGKNKLAWTLTVNNTASSVIIERSSNGVDFQPVVEFWVNMEGNTQRDFTYNDSKAGENNVYYRLLITDKSSSIQQSNVILCGN